MLAQKLSEGIAFLWHGLSIGQTKAPHGVCKVTPLRDALGHDAVAVVLDLLDPAGAGRRLIGTAGSVLDETG